MMMGWNFPNMLCGRNKAINKTNQHNCVYSYDENNTNINNSSAILGSEVEWE